MKLAQRKLLEKERKGGAIVATEGTEHEGTECNGKGEGAVGGYWGGGAQEKWQRMGVLGVCVQWTVIMME